MRVQAHSSAKLILSGEHSVVYGYPALATVTNLKTTTSFAQQQSVGPSSVFITQIINIFYSSYPEYSAKKAYLTKVLSTIPIGCGLGSSAALACSLFRSLAKFHKTTLPSNELISLIQMSETIAHGKPSGVDATTVALNKTLMFKKNIATSEYAYQEVPNTILKKSSFFLINSGTPQESTKEMDELVADAVKVHPRKMKTILRDIGTLTESIVGDVANNSFVPEKLSQNQRLLESLGVVGEEATRMILAIEKIGGFAKTTGAGGVENGSGMILAYHPQKSLLDQLARTNDWKFYQH